MMKPLGSGQTVFALLMTVIVLARHAWGGSDLRLSPEDFTYEGAFKLEEIWKPNYETWEYSNAPIAYYPTGDPNGSNDGYPGSLFVAGHVYRSLVAEMAVPKPVISKNIEQLNTAGFLQNFKDVLAPIPLKAGQITGMTYLSAQGQQSRGKIYFCITTDYQDIDRPAPSLGWFDTNLATPNSAGAWFLGNELVWNTCRYATTIDPNWANQHTPEKLLATGRMRQSWGIANGPNLYASAPWADGNPPEPNARLSSWKTLMRFGASAPIDSKKYSDSDAYRGAAWLTSGGKTAVAITALKDIDSTRAYYGHENWETPNQCESLGTCKGQRGHRCGNCRASILLFDPADLAAVANGAAQSYQPQWYARVDINDYMIHSYGPTFLSTGAEAETLSATYDLARGLLYVSESYADSAKPIVHVFRVTASRNSQTSSIVPTSP